MPDALAFVPAALLLPVRLVELPGMGPDYGEKLI